MHISQMPSFLLCLPVACGHVQVSGNHVKETQFGQRETVQGCAVQCSAVMYSAVLWCTLQCYDVQGSAVMHSAVSVLYNVLYSLVHCCPPNFAL